MIAISLVSHGHGRMVSELVLQLLKYPEVAKIFVTLNIQENIELPADTKVCVINNVSPKGFAENHNYALLRCDETFFCPINPDVKMSANPFPLLIESINKENADLIAPKILNQNGQIEDSVRYFPTPYSIFKKLFFKNLGTYNLQQRTENFYPEWVAGMFIVFRGSSYIALQGFDQGFFLYYEDVDICARAWKAGMKVIVNPSVYVIHDARRSSRVNIFYLSLHIKSMFRYFIKHTGRLPKLPHKILSV